VERFFFGISPQVEVSKHGEKGEHLDHRPSCPLQGQLQQRRGIDAHLLGAYRPAVGMLSEKKTSNVNNRPRKKSM